MGLKEKPLRNERVLTALALGGTVILLDADVTEPPKINLKKGSGFSIASKAKSTSY